MESFFSLQKKETRKKRIMNERPVCVCIYIYTTHDVLELNRYLWLASSCVCVCAIRRFLPATFRVVYTYTQVHTHKSENHQWNNPSRWHPTTSTLIDGHIKQEKRIKPEGIWNHRQRERRKGASQEERDGHQHGESLVMNEWRMRVPPRLNSSSRLYPQTRHDCIWDIWI
jgi:hypothetical protein